MYPLQAGAGSINSLTVSILQYCTQCTVYSTVQLDFVPRRGQSNEIFISMLSLFEATWAADQRVNIFFLFFIFYSSLESWFGRILFTPWGLIPRGVRFPNWNRNKNQYFNPLVSGLNLWKKTGGRKSRWTVPVRQSAFVFNFNFQAAAATVVKLILCFTLFFCCSYFVLGKINTGW